MLILITIGFSPVHQYWLRNLRKILRSTECDHRLQRPSSTSCFGDEASLKYLVIVVTGQPANHDVAAGSASVSKFGRARAHSSSDTNNEHQKSSATSSTPYVQGYQKYRNLLQVCAWEFRLRCSTFSAQYSNKSWQENLTHIFCAAADRIVYRRQHEESLMQRQRLSIFRIIFSYSSSCAHCHVNLTTWYIHNITGWSIARCLNLCFLTQGGVNIIGFTSATEIMPPHSSWWRQRPPRPLISDAERRCGTIPHILWSWRLYRRFESIRRPSTVVPHQHWFSTWSHTTHAQFRCGVLIIALICRCSLLENADAVIHPVPFHHLFLYVGAGRHPGGINMLAIFHKPKLITFRRITRPCWRPPHLQLQCFSPPPFRLASAACAGLTVSLTLNYELMTIDNTWIDDGSL